MFNATQFIREVIKYFSSNFVIYQHQVIEGKEFDGFVSPYLLQHRAGHRMYGTYMVKPIDLLGNNGFIITFIEYSGIADNEMLCFINPPSCIYSDEMIATSLTRDEFIELIKAIDELEL